MDLGYYHFVLLTQSLHCSREYIAIRVQHCRTICAVYLDWEKLVPQHSRALDCGFLCGLLGKLYFGFVPVDYFDAVRVAYVSHHRGVSPCWRSLNRISSLMACRTPPAWTLPLSSSFTLDMSMV